MWIEIGTIIAGVAAAGALALNLLDRRATDRPYLCFSRDNTGRLLLLNMSQVAALDAVIVASGALDSGERVHVVEEFGLVRGNEHRDMIQLLERIHHAYGAAAFDSYADRRESVSLMVTLEVEYVGRRPRVWFVHTRRAKTTVNFGSNGPPASVDRLHEARWARRRL